jgi:hypothetical protein
MNTALTTSAPRGQNIALLATGESLAAIEKIGGWLASIKFAGIEKPELACIVALTCATEGISPVEFTRRYHILGDGRLTLRSDYMLSLFAQGGGRVDWLTTNTKEVKARFSHPQACPDGVVLTLTMKELHERGVTLNPKNGQMKQTYLMYPQQMLVARITGPGCRMAGPASMAGFYTKEELDDEPLNVTPTGHAAAPQAAASADTVSVQATVIPAAGVYIEQAREIVRSIPGAFGAMCAEGILGRSAADPASLAMPDMTAEIAEMVHTDTASLVKMGAAYLAENPEKQAEPVAPDVVTAEEIAELTDLWSRVGKGELQGALDWAARVAKSAPCASIAEMSSAAGYVLLKELRDRVAKLATAEKAAA